LTGIAIRAVLGQSLRALALTLAVGLVAYAAAIYLGRNRLYLTGLYAALRPGQARSAGQPAVVRPASGRPIGPMMRPGPVRAGAMQAGAVQAGVMRASTKQAGRHRAPPRGVDGPRDERTRPAAGQGGPMPGPQPARGRTPRTTQPLRRST
jgi:hypothetical protein